MSYLDIEPLPTTFDGSMQIRRCMLRRGDQAGISDEKELWFAFDREVHPPAADDCDSYLLASILDAMAEHRAVRVHGSVSGQLLSNLVEFQGAWEKWLPETYRMAPITVTSVRIEERPAAGAVCAFSGGVDATFSVWRHTQKLWSHRSQEIKACALVHGFDIPLKNEEAYRTNFERAASTLADVRLPLLKVATNYRATTNVNWEHAFSCALVAVLSNLKHVAGTCIVGSSEPYDALVIPWGSSPITDHLLSSGEFVVIHDGATHSRTQKVDAIAAWPAGANSLRVCWQGELKDRNCGRCEKCLRTMLNFIVSGHPPPSCFPSGDIKAHLPAVRLRNDVVRAEWSQIHAHGIEHGIEPALIEAINRVARPRFWSGSRLKPLLSKWRARLKPVIG